MPSVQDKQNKANRKRWRKRVERRLRRLEAGITALTMAVFAPKVELGGTPLPAVISDLIGGLFS